MNEHEISVLKDIWINSIVGKDIDYQENNIYKFLYNSFISRNDEILKSLNISIPSSKDLGFLDDLVNCFTEVNTNPLGFFPKGILQSKSLTCAGIAMLINTVLKDKGYDVKYARPVSHSVNIVKYRDKYYWIDGANTVMDEINMEFKKMGKFSIGYITSNNPKINYRISPILSSEDIIVNVFGNTEALKSKKGTSNIVDVYLTNNQDLYNINFNTYLEHLYKEYFDYIRYDPEFNKEQSRVKNWLSKE